MTHPTELRFESRDRSSILGGSEVGVVLGLAPSSWGSPLDVWARKTQGEAEKETTPAMSAGTRFESTIVEWIAEEFGADDLIVLDHGPFDPFIVHPERDWLGCHPDGFLEKDGRWYAIEAKMSGVAGAFGAGEQMPPTYWVQAQVEAACTGMPVVFGAFRTRERDLWMRVIEPRPDDINRMLDKAESWWNEHVEGDVPPPLEGDAAMRYLVGKHPVGGSIILDANGQQEAAIARWRELDEQSKVLKRELATAKAAVCSAIGDDGGMRSPLGTARWISSKGRQSVSLSALTKHDDIMEMLSERGLIKTGKPIRSLRWTANKGEE